MEPAEDLEITSQPGSRTISETESPVTFDLTVTGVPAQGASLLVENPPPGFEFLIKLDSLSKDGNATLTVTYKGAAPGTYKVKVYAYVDGENNAFTTITLIVPEPGEPEEPSGTWELFIDPEEKEIDPGEDVAAITRAPASLQT